MIIIQLQNIWTGKSKVCKLITEVGISNRLTDFVIQFNGVSFHQMCISELEVTGNLKSFTICLRQVTLTASKSGCLTCRETSVTSHKMLVTKLSGADQVLLLARKPS